MTFPKFSKREKEVIKYLLEGKTNKQIAQKLSISVRTIEFHLGNIYARLDTRSRTETAVKLTQLSLGKSTGKNTSKAMRSSTVAKKDIQVDNGKNQTKRSFTMKNLLIGITVGGLLTLLIIFTISYVNRSNEAETATLSSETPTPVPSLTALDTSSNPTSNKSDYGFHLRQFDSATPFFANAPYPNEITSIGDKDLLRLDCSREYSIGWFGNRHEYRDSMTQERQKIYDPLMETFLASATLMHPDKSITSISYCQVENENPFFIYRVCGGGDGCFGIPNIAFAKLDGPLTWVTEIFQEGFLEYNCTPLMLTTQNLLYMACRGDDAGFITKVDLTSSSVEIVQSCKETENGVICD